MEPGDPVLQGDADTHWIPPGYAVVGAADQGVAGTFRLIEHSGARVSGDESRSVTFLKPAMATWFAWYSEAVSSNGWEPYDQPHACAYLPIAYSQLARHQTANGWLLRQRHSRAVSSVTVLHRELWVVETSFSGLLARLGGVLAAAGVQEADQEAAVAFVGALASEVELARVRSAF